MDASSLNVIVPLVISSGSGLAFIAYRHPREFESLAKCLNALLIIFVCYLIIWDYAIGDAEIAALQSGAIAPGKIGIIREAINACNYPSWLPIVCAIILAYLLFLSSFPVWLLPDTPAEEE